MIEFFIYLVEEKTYGQRYLLKQRERA